MKKITLFIAFMISSIIYLFAEQDDYYYYKNAKFQLQVDSTRFFIISDGELFLDKSFTAHISDDKHKSKQFVTSINRISKEKITNNYLTEISILNPNKDSHREINYRIKKISNVINVLPAYTINNKKIGVSNILYVKLFKEEDFDKLVNLSKRYSVEILGNNKYMPLLYTLSCTKDSYLNTLDVANLFFETGMFEFSEPHILQNDLLTSNDSLFQYQWGLKNIGQYYTSCHSIGIDIRAEEAWSITTGSQDIKVAVFDEGIEINHPDLQNSILGTGFDAYTSTSPAILRGPHGTMCAGVITATQNNLIGISGICPTSKLISISCNFDFVYDYNQWVDGFTWACQNGVDILSCSWGWWTPSSSIDIAIQNLLTNGRNGLGAVVVFAAGNENNTNIRYPGNCNPNILVVGMIGTEGIRKMPYACEGYVDGSCYGSQLDIMAPGVLVPTTDRQGTFGLDPGDYIINTNGTSIACPNVAGVAALVLSANPTLSGQQVRDIIEGTAQKTGGYNYQTTSGRANGTWHQEMGYGLVDANAAVQASCSAPYSIFNQTIITDKIINSCGNIYIENVSVESGAKMILNSTVSTTINCNFEVELGSELEIY